MELIVLRMKYRIHIQSRIWHYVFNVFVPTFSPKPVPVDSCTMHKPATMSLSFNPNIVVHCTAWLTKYFSGVYRFPWSRDRSIIHTAGRDVKAVVIVMWRMWNFWENMHNYVYNIILINNSWRKDKGNQWHDGGCISDTKFCWFT